MFLVVLSVPLQHKLLSHSSRRTRKGERCLHVGMFTFTVNLSCFPLFSFTPWPPNLMEASTGTAKRISAS